MSIIAKGSYYFQSKDFPVSIKVIEPNSKKSHPHDLTFVNHHHDFSELVIVTRGKGVQSINGVHCQVSAGDVFLLKDYDDHCFIEQHDLSLLNIMFDNKTITLPDKLLEMIPSYNVIFDLNQELNQKHHFNSYLKLTHAKLLDISSIANLIIKELEQKFIGYQSAVYGYLIQLITIICREYSNIQSNKGKSFLRVSKIISLLEQEFNRQWTLEELAKVACMSENNLLLLFKEATGQSPIAYANTIKLKTSSMLLKSTDKSITAIAMECGFNDSNYFTRQFKKEFGVSPSQFRKI